MTEIFDRQVWQKSETEKWDRKVWQKSMTEKFDRIVWQKIVTEKIDRKIWQTSLTEKWDRKVWQKSVTKKVWYYLMKNHRIVGLAEANKKCSLLLTCTTITIYIDQPEKPLT